MVSEPSSRHPPDFEAFADNAPDVIVRFDRELRHVYVNRAIERITGRSVRDFIGRTNEELGMPAAQVATWRGALGAVFDTGADGELEFDFESPGGKRSFHARLVPERDAGGAIVSVVVVTRDVTGMRALLATRRVEQDQRFLASAGALLASSLEPEAILVNIARLAVPAIADGCVGYLRGPGAAIVPVAIEHGDPDKLELLRRLAVELPVRATDATGVVRVLFFGSAAELYSQVADDVLAAAARSPEELALLRALGLRSTMVVPIAGRAGVHGALSFISSDSGRRYGAADLEIAQDLGRRAALAIENARFFQAEQQARQAAERAIARAQVLQRLSAALANVLTPGMAAEVVARAVREATGASACLVWLLDHTRGLLVLADADGHGAPGLDAYRELALDAPLPVCEAVRTALPVVAPTSAEHAASSPAIGDGPEAGAPSWAAIPLLVEGRAVGGLSLSFSQPKTLDEADRELMISMGSQCAQAIERTRLFQAEQMARAAAEQAYATAQQAERRKDEFLAMLGHELRNPLAPIVTALELMEMKGAGAEKERRVIARQVDHLSRLVDDLLDVSRITRGKIELSLALLDVSAILATAIEMASPLLERRHHTLSLDVQRGLVVAGDATRLAQVFANLLTNAARYTEPGGRISVAAIEEAGQVVVRVTDSGIGIRGELLPEIFEMFVQGDRTVDRAEGGLGLGLTLVRSLLKMHGGTVLAHSDGPGRGSEFTVRLPCPEAAAVQAEQSAASSRSGAVRPKLVRRVLVVDDNDDLREQMAELLQALGHEVATAEDGPGALAIAGGFRPDIALLDIGLPVMDGYELAPRLRSLVGDARLQLVAVTGYGQESDRDRARDAGFDEHMVKPLDLRRLERVLADAGSRQG